MLYGFKPAFHLFSYWNRSKSWQKNSINIDSVSTIWLTMRPATSDGLETHMNCSSFPRVTAAGVVNDMQLPFFEYVRSPPAGFLPRLFRARFLVPCFHEVHRPAGDQRVNYLLSNQFCLVLSIRQKPDSLPWSHSLPHLQSPMSFITSVQLILQTQYLCMPVSYFIEPPFGPLKSMFSLFGFMEEKAEILRLNNLPKSTQPVRSRAWISI